MCTWSFIFHFEKELETGYMHGFETLVILNVREGSTFVHMFNQSTFLESK
jgi:hypothetical protein